MTNLRNKIARSLPAFFDPSVKEKDVADDILAAIKDSVPPLVWLGGAGRYHAKTYVIEDVSVGQREIRRLLCANFGTTYLGDYSGHRPLEAAQSAANAHHVAQVTDWMVK